MGHSVHGHNNDRRDVFDTQAGSGTQFIQELSLEQDTYLVGIAWLGRWCSNLSDLGKTEVSPCTF